MQGLKILGLLALVAAAAMAFAASASATVVTAPAGTAYTGTIKAESENGHVSLHNPQANIECDASGEGSVTSHGSTVTAEGAGSLVTITGCTGGWTVTTNVKGSGIAHATSKRQRHTHIK